MIRLAQSPVLAVPVARRADSPGAVLAFLGARRLRGSISPAAVDAIAAAIQTQEGYYPGSLAYRNNNPGNLVYVGQPGATAGAGGFASFQSYDAGLAALKNQIALDAARGTDVNGKPTTTVAELISSWAPPSENNTAAYIASVAAQTGFDPDAPLASLGASTAGPVDSAVLPDFSSGASTPDFFGGSQVDLSAVGLGSVSSGWLALGVAGFLGLLFIRR